MLQFSFRKVKQTFGRNEYEFPSVHWCNGQARLTLAQEHAVVAVAYGVRAACWRYRMQAPCPTQPRTAAASSQRSILREVESQTLLIPKQVWRLEASQRFISERNEHG